MKEARKPIKGSDQQEAIWKAMVEDQRHLVVKARAGTGKTTTMVEGMYRMKDKGFKGSMAFVAFNKAIASELGRRVPDGVVACTMHSLGMNSLRQAFGRVHLEEDKVERTLEEIDPAMLFSVKMAAIKLAGLAKNTLVPLDKGVFEGELDKLVEHYGVDLDGVDLHEVSGLVLEALERGLRDKDQIDFDDMLYMPVMLNVAMPRYDFLGVDECQDLNRVQQVMVLRTGKRIMVVGDERQAIYGFRGADAYSMKNMEETLDDRVHTHNGHGVTVLPLTKTRRCPKAVVELAKKIVPDFEALVDAPLGKIEWASEDEIYAGLEPGDMVLCRVNAPTVSWAFRMLASGRKARIQGRDLGRTISLLVRKLMRPSRDERVWPEQTTKVLVEKVRAYRDLEMSKLAKSRQKSKESRMQLLLDKTSCVEAVADGVKSVEEVLDRVSLMFTDGEEKDATLFSSLHRAKGLEAKRVVILRPDLMPFPKAREGWEMEQEYNLMYVGYTRSMDTLVFATPQSQPNLERSMEVAR